MYGLYCAIGKNATLLLFLQKPNTYFYNMGVINTYMDQNHLSFRQYENQHQPQSLFMKFSMRILNEYITNSEKYCFLTLANRRWVSVFNSQNSQEWLYWPWNSESWSPYNWNLLMLGNLVKKVSKKNTGYDFIYLLRKAWSCLFIDKCN